VSFNPSIVGCESFSNIEDLLDFIDDNKASNNLYIGYVKQDNEYLQLDIESMRDMKTQNLTKTLDNFTEQWKTFDQDKKKQVAESIAGLKESIMFTRLMDELADKVQG